MRPRKTDKYSGHGRQYWDHQSQYLSRCLTAVPSDWYSQKAGQYGGSNLPEAGLGGY
jgi:hypothetical protein